MKSPHAKLNRQKELKRSYRRKYKDLQAVAATTTTTPTTAMHPIMTTSSKTTQNVQPIETVMARKQKKVIDKERPNL